MNFLFKYFYIFTLICSQTIFSSDFDVKTSGEKIVSNVKINIKNLTSENFETFVMNPNHTYAHNNFLPISSNHERGYNLQKFNDNFQTVMIRFMATHDPKHGKPVMDSSLFKLFDITPSGKTESETLTIYFEDDQIFLVDQSGTVLNKINWK